VGAIAQRESGFAVMFTVMDWNHHAIDFNQKLGATFMDDWKVVCLKGDTLAVLEKEERL
jgi:hypothetical protein